MIGIIIIVALLWLNCFVMEQMSLDDSVVYTLVYTLFMTLLIGSIAFIPLLFLLYLYYKGKGRK